MEISKATRFLLLGLGLAGLILTSLGIMEILESPPIPAFMTTGENSE